MSEEKREKRTPLQNRALHKYFEIVAKLFNDAGLDMKKVLKPEVDIPWTKDTVKEYMWKPIQKAQLRKESTTELYTDEVTKVFETVNRYIAKKGIHQPFPSMEAIMNQIRADDDRKRLLKKKEK